MMLTATFVDAGVFAKSAGIGLRCAQKALSRAASGQRWRGHQLTVREINGQGGRSGKCYQVDIFSLPVELRTLIQSPTQPELPLSTILTLGKSWKRDLVVAVRAAGPAASPSRAKAIQTFAATVKYPEGKKAGKLIGERTLRSWVSQYEKRGELSLARARRSDRGNERVHAWRSWDRVMDAAGVSQEVQAASAKKIVSLVKSLWASGASSASWLQFIAKPDLRDIARTAVPTLSDSQLDSICHMPPGFILRHQRARLAHQKRTDAGSWAADKVPRVLRDRSQLKPMEMVAADVRHSDIMILRQDGSQATPKMIVFEDLATNRIFSRVYVMKKGEMIRREHVLAAFRDMFSDPSWGVPQQLYLDNGGEFKTGSAADELGAIAGFLRQAQAIEMNIFDFGELQVPTGTVRSRAYNPQSKIIEGVFSNFTRTIEPMFPGFVGGNRMAKKVENQGKAKLPMPGDEATITANFDTMVRLYNAKTQQRGHIKGASPDAAFGSYVNDGWQSIICNPLEFTMAFGKDQVRLVKAGGEFEYDGKTYRHDSLAILAGERVNIRVPILDASRIPVIGDKGEILCVASEPPRYGMRDLAGAKEQQRRASELSRQVQEEVSGVPKVDLPQKLRRALDELPLPAVSKASATVSIHPRLREAAEESSQVSEPQTAMSPLARKAAFAKRANDTMLRRAS